jgi:hypothetical protein
MPGSILNHSRIFLSSLDICKALQKIQTQCIIHYFIIIFLHAHPKKWQNNQRIDGGHILVEVEASIVSTVL